MLYSITYELAYKQDVGPKGSSRLENYFMFVGLSVSLSSLLALLTYGDYLPSDENSFHILLPNLTFNLPEINSHQNRTASKSCLDSDNQSKATQEEADKEVNEKKFEDSRSEHDEESEQLIGNVIEVKGFLAVLATAKFHLIFWPSIILYGVKGMVLGNVLVYLEDFDIEGYTNWIPYMALGVSLVHKIVVGYVSDRFLYLFPRSWFLLLAAIFGILGYILAMMELHTILGVVSVILLWTLSAETIPALTPVILLDDHGMKTFSRTVGLLFAGGSFVIFIGQVGYCATFAKE